MNPLNAHGSAVVGADGQALVAVGPSPLESWQLNRITVTVAGTTTEPQARVYLDTESAGSLVGGTYSGSLDSSDEALSLRPGQQLLCRWTGADPGSVATLTVFGARMDARR